MTAEALKTKKEAGNSSNYQVITGGSRKTKKKDDPANPSVRNIGVQNGAYALLFAISGQMVRTPSGKIVKDRYLFPKSAGAAINCFMGLNALNETNSIDCEIINEQFVSNEEATGKPWGSGWKYNIPHSAVPAAETSQFMRRGTQMELF